jgi:hypothetical protein
MTARPTITRTNIAATVAVVIGLAVVVFLVMQLNAPAIEPAHLLRYRLGGTENQIVVTVARGHCDPVNDTRVLEDASSVHVTVLVERTRGTCTADIVFQEVSLTLASPLAGRAVFDSAGAPLPLEPR